MFNIEWSSEAGYQLSKLEHSDIKRIIHKMEKAADNPTHYFKRLTGRNEWKLRVGDYRVIVRLNISKKRIFVVTLGHRKTIYKEV